jgi:hypothetical protein
MSIIINEDNKGKCLCGLTLPLENLSIKPITVREVLEVGENKYNSYLTVLLMPDKLFAHLTNNIPTKEQKIDFKSLSNFEILLIFCSIYPDFINSIQEAFSFFVKKRLMLKDTKDGFFIIVENDDTIEMDEKLYNQLVDLIRLMTYMFNHETQIEKPAGKKAKELLEQKKALQAKINTLKQKASDAPLSLVDYISILISTSREVDVTKCLDMTIYGLYDYIERQALLDSYDVGVKQLLAGAKPDEVNLKHWLSKL